MKKTPRRMIILGLTGGIGMGKSAVAGILHAYGAPIYNADHQVHALLRKGGQGVRPVAKLFPASYRRGAIDRKLLGTIVFGRRRKLKKLEKILHPLVRQAEKKFLQAAQRKKALVAVLEIPLLFETGGDKRCDYVICVKAPKKVQRARVLQRRGMTRQKLKAIRAHQLPEKTKQKRADYVINTGGSRAQTKKQLCRMLDQILKN